MADNRYIVTHSNYTIKKKHKSLPNETIYERDYMATTNLGDFDSGSIPYEDGNFKIVYNDEKKTKRKHKYGNWLKNENCDTKNDDSCEYFSLKNMPTNSSAITSETKIEIKSNKNNFFDFVYYGNCTEMIKSSVNEIILKFPAELYVTGENYTYMNSAEEIEVLGGEDWVVISNPFEIDIVSQSLPNKIKNDPDFNPMRYFAESYSKYRIINNNDESICINSWDVDIRKKNCFLDGDITATITLNSGETSEITIRRYFKDNSFVLLVDKEKAGFRIRPTDGAINNFFNKIDDFSKFLLNRESNPIYSIEIDTPRETDRGIVFYRETYTWPTEYDYNIDIHSTEYGKYYTSLLSLSEWYDENKVDNLWRNMTHDAIKNMDRTHTDVSRDEDNEDYMIGTSKLQGLMHAWGRQFDDIKRSIDNIKTVNKITYDENNNTPDYFLTDTLELSGWEVRDAVETIDKNTKTGILFLGSNKKYDTVDANLQFMRNLKLNSRAIFSRKGTKESIEMLLSLFGLCSYDWAKKAYNMKPESTKKHKGRKALSWDNLSEKDRNALYDYSLDEYVTTITNNASDIVYEDEVLPAEKYNSYKKEANEVESRLETLGGLPVRLVTIEQIERETPVTKKYLIPWFSKKDKLDGNPYFQMFGGWGKALKRDVVPNKEFYPNVDEIETISGFTVYDETKKYLKFVNNVNDLSRLSGDDVKSGDIFYVNNLDDFTYYYPSEDLSGATNYFTIDNVDNINIYGETSGQTGWVNISRDTLSCDNGATPIAYKVIYLESIIEDNTGNNPHIGNGNYDDGETYLDYFRQIFKGAIENDAFTDDAYDCETGEILDEIKECGFAVRESVVDNVKTWFFTDTTKTGIYRLEQKMVTAYDEDYDEYELPIGYNESEITDVVNVGRRAYNNGEVGFKSELSAFNLETQMDDNNDEAAANSIINTKKLVLKFNEKYTIEKGFKEYLYTVILPYVKQVIPSTSIFEVILDNTEVDYTCFNFAEIAGMSK